MFSLAGASRVAGLILAHVSGISRSRLIHQTFTPVNAPTEACSACCLPTDTCNLGDSSKKPFLNKKETKKVCRKTGSPLPLRQTFSKHHCESNEVDYMRSLNPKKGTDFYERMVN